MKRLGQKVGELVLDIDTFRTADRLGPSDPMTSGNPLEEAPVSEAGVSLLPRLTVAQGRCHDLVRVRGTISPKSRRVRGYGVCTDSIWRAKMNRIDRVSPPRFPDRSEPGSKRSPRSRRWPIRLLHAVGLALAILLTAAAEGRAQESFAGVFRGGADGHFLWSNVVWADFESKWSELAGKGLRLVDVETYVVDGVRKYTGVWRQGNDAHFLWAGADWASFTAKWSELNDRGLRLIDVETYVDGDKRKYIGVWRQGTDGHFLLAGVDSGSLKAKWSELAKQGLRLIDVETYDEGGKRKYIGVWREGDDGHYLWAGVSWALFINKWQKLNSLGLRLIDFETYLHRGKRKYIGVWRAGTDVNALWVGVDWENFVSKWRELSKDGLRLEDIETYEGCQAACANQVVSDDPYVYGITRTNMHCPGVSGSCGEPDVNDVVYYRWPVDEVFGVGRYVRLSAVMHSDAFLKLPFSDAEVKRNGIWRYGSGDYHHAGDYGRDDVKTFIVKAAAAGRVIHIGWDGWSGNTVILSHDVNGVQDAYRTIYMHLRNGAQADCANSWSKSMPSLGYENRIEFDRHLYDTGCTEDPSKRSLDAAHWGTDAQTIDSGLLGKTVAQGATLAWAGNTGPGGKRGTGGPNTHLHIFWTRRDLTNNEWYFFDPYGIYAMPDCYPAGVTDPIGGACARYPIAWKDRKPQYP